MTDNSGYGFDVTPEALRECGGRKTVVNYYAITYPGISRQAGFAGVGGELQNEFFCLQNLSPVPIEEKITEEKISLLGKNK